MGNIKTNGWKLPDGNIYEFIPPSPTENERGGIIATERTETDTVEVKLGTDGKLYVPEYPEIDNTSVAIEVAPIHSYSASGLPRINILELKSKRPYAAPIVEGEKPNQACFLIIPCDDGTVKQVGAVFTENIFYVTISGTKAVVDQYNYNSSFSVDFTDKSTANNVIVTRLDNISYLGINNGVEFTPTKNYQPATKKYVDDAKTEANTYTDTKESELIQSLNTHNSSSTAHSDIRNTISEHINDKENPHGVTASQVGADPSGTAETKVTAHNTATDSHNDIRLALNELSELVTTLLDSDDETLNQTSEIVAYIKSNKSLIDGITTGKVSVSDIVNNLTTNVANKPLSAAQGVQLKALIDELKESVEAIVIPVQSVNGKTGAVQLTASDVSARPNTWTPSKSDVGLSKVDNVKQYSASNPPPYPVTSVNGQTGDVKVSVPTKTSELTNDSGYVVSEDLGGTIEITDGDPENTQTILTIDPNAEEVNMYSAEEVDAMLAEKQAAITQLSNEVGNFSAQTNENTENISNHEDRIALVEKTITDTSTVPMIPDYWKAAVDALEDKIKELQDNGGKDSFQFIRVSDIHGVNGASTTGAGKSVTKYIGAVARYAMDKFNIPVFIISGDIMSQASHTNEESVWKEYEGLKTILSPVKADELLAVKGNHDGAWGSPVTINGVATYYLYNIGKKKIYNAIYRRQAKDRTKVFGGDGTYFYVDIHDMRIFMLNAHTDGDGSVDENGYAAYNSMKNSVYGQEQLEWICDSLMTMKDGMRAIVVSHPPILSSKDGNILSGIITAFNNKTTYSGNVAITGDYWGTDPKYASININTDFTNTKGKVEAFFYGHIHKDVIDTTSHSFPCIAITTAGGDVRDTNPVERVPGTATETAIDIVTLNNDGIYMTRLGAGSDRSILSDNTVISDYSISYKLTNCTSSNKVTSVSEGGSYNSTISVNSGYELDSVTVTMGGTDVTSSVYVDGVITISEVTGNVVITASATLIPSEEEPSGTYTNQIPISKNADGTLFVGTNGEAGYKTGYRISGSTGAESALEGVEVTGFIPFEYEDTVYMKNITDDGTHVIGFYDISHAKLATLNISNIFGGDINGEIVSKKIDSFLSTDIGNAGTNIAFMRVSANEITDASIITVNEPITNVGYTNLADPNDESWLNDTRFSTSTAGNTSAQVGMVVTNYIQLTGDDGILRVKGLDLQNDPYGIKPILVRYSDIDSPSNIVYIANYATYDGETNISVVDIGSHVLAGEYFRFSANLVDGYTVNDVIITLGEEITDGSGDDTTTGYTNLFDTTATGFVDETTKFYTNWIPYNGDDNDGNGTIYHFKGLVYGAGQQNPYKMNFATDANGSNASSQFYCTAANKQVPVAADYDSSVTIVQHQTSGYTHVRFEIREALPDNLIITANENIVDDNASYTNVLSLAQEYASTATYVGTDGSVGYGNNMRLSSSSPTTTYMKALDGVDTTALIPIKRGDILRFKNCNFKVTPANTSYGSFIQGFDRSKAILSNGSAGRDNLQNRMPCITEGDEYVQITLEPLEAWTTSEIDNWAYIMISTDGLDETSIITINEEIS